MEDPRNPLPSSKWCPYCEMINAPQVPGVTAGALVAKCEEPGCNWEAVYVLPEEFIRYLLAIMAHMRDAHGCTIPKITGQYL